MNKRPVIFFSVAAIAAVLALVLIPDRSEGETIPDSPAVAAASVAQKRNINKIAITEIQNKLFAFIAIIFKICRKGKKFFSKNSTQIYTFANDNGELYVFYLKSIESEF